MDLTVALVFVIVFLATYVFFTKPKNLPPGPLRLPFLGSIFFFQKCKNQYRHKVVHQAANTYGNVMTLQSGRKLVVYLNGYDVIHEALVKKADVLSDRPQNIGVFYRALKDMPGEGIIFQPYGDSWRMLRRFTLQALRDMGLGKTSTEEKIYAEVEAITKHLDDTNEAPVSLTPLLQTITGNVLFGIVFGKRYDYGDPEFETIRQLAGAVLSGRGLFSPILFLPRCIARLISKKDVDDLDNRVSKGLAIRDFVLQQIDEHEKTYDPENIRDFVDIYLQVIKDQASDKDTITRGSLFRVIMDLFLAGTDSTATTLDWMFLYMSEFPEVQRKCREEIDEVLGQKRIEFADLGKLPYVAATIQEVQRVATIAPFAPPRRAMKDTTLMGYNIPAGTSVVINYYSASFDSKHWHEPEKFDPTRFLDKSGRYIKREANIPFGEGPRVCLGESLARMELFVVFANLLHRFQFLREDSSVKHSLEPKLYSISNSPKPYRVRVSRRY